MNPTNVSPDDQPRAEQPQPEPDNTSVTPANAIATPEPYVTQAVIMTAKPRSKTKLFAISIAILGLVLAGGAAAYYHRKPSAQPVAKSASTPAQVAKTPTPTADTPMRRIYQRYGGRGHDSTLTMTDEAGKVIATHTVEIPLQLAANLHNTYFILKEDDLIASALSGPEDYGGHYWLMDADGSFSRIDPKVDAALRKGAGGNNPVRALYPVSSTEVAYYQCASDMDPYCGTLHVINIQDGATRTYEIGQGIGAGLSNDGSIAYLWGLDYQSHNIDMLSYSLSSKKVIKHTRLPDPGEGVRQFWVSPAGSYIAYADESAHTIGIFNVKTGKTTKTTMPKTWELNSWSGEVTLPIPQWSPDETSIAFIAWDQSHQYLAYTTVSSGSYKLIDTLNTSKDAPETLIGSGDHHSFSAIGWPHANQLEYSTTNSLRTSDFGTATANKSHVIGAKTIELPTKYGNLMEVNYTLPAL